MCERASAEKRRGAALGGAGEGRRVDEARRGRRFFFAAAAAALRQPLRTVSIARQSAKLALSSPFGPCAGERGGRVSGAPNPRDGERMRARRRRADEARPRVPT